MRCIDDDGGGECAEWQQLIVKFIQNIQTNRQYTQTLAHRHIRDNVRMFVCLVRATIHSSQHDTAAAHGNPFAAEEEGGYVRPTFWRVKPSFRVCV